MLKAIRLMRRLLIGLAWVAAAVFVLSPKGARTPAWAGGARLSVAALVAVLGLVLLNGMLSHARRIRFRLQGRLVRMADVEAITGDRFMTFGPVETEGAWLLTFRVDRCGAVVELEWPGGEEPPVRIHRAASERSGPARTSEAWVESAGRLTFAVRVRLSADSAFREESFRLTGGRRPGEVVTARWVLTITGPGRVLAFPPEPARDDEAMGFPIVVPAGRPVPIAPPVPAIPIGPVRSDETDENDVTGTGGAEMIGRPKR